MQSDDGLRKMSLRTARSRVPRAMSEWRPQLGERVCIGGVKQGVLRYFGLTAFAQGCWCGVELDEAVGKNNGTVNGVVYFDCRPNHGIFAPVTKVSKLNDWPPPSESPPQDPPPQYNNHLKSSHSEPGFARTAPSKVHHFPLDRSRDPSPFNNNHSHIQKAIKSSYSEPAFAKAPQPNHRRDPSPFNNNNHAHFEKSIIKNSHSEPVFEKAPPNQRRDPSPFNNNHAPQERSRAVVKCSASTRSLSKYGKKAVDVQSPGVKRYPEASPDGFLSSFQPHDFSDFEDEDNEDRMSVDESLGILTPSQMRDLTLGTEFARGVDFPSSESFDDINELPEDEQVVSVVTSLGTTSSRGCRSSPNVTHGEFLDSISQKASRSRRESFQDCRMVVVSESCEEYSETSYGRPMNGYSQVGGHEEYRGRSKAVESHRAQSKKSEAAAVNGCSHLDGRKEYMGRPELVESLGRSRNDAVVNGYTQMDGCEGYMGQPELMESLGRVRNGYSQIDRREEYKGRAETFVRLPRNEVAESGHSYVEVEEENGMRTETTESRLRNDTAVNGYSQMGGHEEYIGRPGFRNVYPKIDVQDDEYTVRTESRGSLRNGTAEHSEMDVQEEYSPGRITNGLVESRAAGHHVRQSIREELSCPGRERGEEPLSGYLVVGRPLSSSPALCSSIDNNGGAETETGGLLALKEKATVSWEESEEGMTASLLDERFGGNNSKMAESSNTTSGYSTGLSDSCCGNDKAEDYSEDACSLQESVEVTTEVVVSSETITEIHSLLVSPEEGAPVAIDPHEETQRDHEPPPQEVVAPETIPPDASNTTAVRTTEERQGPKKNRAPETVVQQPSSRAPQPKKNVMSKIKAMIESKAAASTSKAPPRKSRWEAVTSKIAAGMAEEKANKGKREVRSRVDTNLLARGSPRLLDGLSSAEGSLSPGSARDRRVAASVSLREGRSKPTKDSKRPKSPRPLRRLLSLVAGCTPLCRTNYVLDAPPGVVASRSASPVAASESSATSVSLTSHNSRSKIAHWKGSSSTIASSATPVVVSRRSAAAAVTVPATKPPLQTGRTRLVTKKPPVPKIRISAPPATQRGDKPPQTRPNRTSTNKESDGGVVVRPTHWLSKAELGQEIQRLGTLCEARTKELNRLKMETKHVSVGFDAFAALFKYMVEDLNGLSVPVLSADLQKTLKQLELAKQDLAYYEREVEELKSHHCQELNDLSNKLFEVFQGEVTELSTKHEEEMGRLKLDHQKQIETLTLSLNASSEEALSHHEKAVAELQQELINQREELQLFHGRELEELEAKHSQSTKTLQEHIEQMQKQCAELKQHSLSMEDAMKKDTNSKLQWVTSRKLDLEKEVESLKAVLEMKNKELHTIRVQNLEMEKQLEELPLAREKIKMLQARAEDLEALMAEKTKVERKLSTENHQIRETYEKESKVNRRLSMENEELQWRLRQAEQSFVTGSFTEVPEDPEEESNSPTSPAKSPSKSPGPNPMSRSIFFTYVDDTCPSPKSSSAYKKITPGFSANYKTNSPARSSSAGRSKSHSEPPPPSSTPRKGKKSTPKRTRAGTGDVTEQQLKDAFSMSVAGSMASSLSSECSSVYSEQRLLEEHGEQILHSLEILREQRNSEELGSNEGDGVYTINVEQGSKEHRLAGDQNGLHSSDIMRNVEEGSSRKKELMDEHGVAQSLEIQREQSEQRSVEEQFSLEIPSRKEERSSKKQLSLELTGQDPDFLNFDSPEEHKEQILISLEMFQEQKSSLGSRELRAIREQSEQFLRSLEILQGKYNEEERLFLEQHKEQIRHSLQVLQKGEDEMSRSSEFSDPKTYYHMTFPGTDQSHSKSEGRS